MRYRDLVANPQPKPVPPSPPGNRGHPPTLDQPSADRPWRAADLHQPRAFMLVGDWLAWATWKVLLTWENVDC